jgi:hypothetical protein
VDEGRTIHFSLHVASTVPIHPRSSRPLCRPPPGIRGKRALAGLAGVLAEGQMSVMAVLCQLRVAVQLLSHLRFRTG